MERFYGRVFDTAVVEAPGAEVGQLGEVSLPPFQMNVALRWAVRNAGTADGYVALKVWLIEKKGWPVADVEWVIFTPLAREGGPKLAKDIVAGETTQKTSYSAAPVLIAPGATRVASTVLYLPGYEVTADLADFWNKHAGAPFKVVVQALHITLVGEHVADLGAYTFDEAFRLAKVLKEAKLETLATHNNVAQPELSVTII